MDMDAVGQRPVAVGGPGWHRLGAAGRAHEAKRRWVEGGHVHGSIVGRGVLVSGLGAHLGSGGHSICGAEGLGRRPSRPWDSLHAPRHFHPARSHEADVDVRPCAHQRVVGGVWRIRGTGSPRHAGRCSLGLRSGLSNAPPLQEKVVAHRLRSGRIACGDVQSAGGGHCVCGGSHHD